MCKSGITVSLLDRTKDTDVGESELIKIRIAFKYKDKNILNKLFTTYIRPN